MPEDRLKDGVRWPCFQYHESNRCVVRVLFDNKGPVKDMMWMAGACLKDSCCRARAQVPLQWQRPMPQDLRMMNVRQGGKVIRAYSTDPAGCANWKQSMWSAYRGYLAKLRSPHDEATTL